MLPLLYMISWSLWGEWSSRLRHCDQNWRVLGSNPTRKPRYEAPGDIQVEIAKMQGLTSGWWGCPLENGPKLTVGQPNSNLKKYSRFYYVRNCKKKFIFRRSTMFMTKKKPVFTCFHKNKLSSDKSFIASSWKYTEYYHKN